MHNLLSRTSMTRFFFMSTFTTRIASGFPHQHSTLLRSFHKTAMASLDDADLVVSSPPAGMQQVLFIETGFGSDQHGQDPTKACIKACKDAISFNSIPSIGQVVPGGRSNMKLRVQLAVPFVCHENGDYVEPTIDLKAVAAVFPYGDICNGIEVQRGGMLASSGAAVKKLGDSGDDWIIAIAAVTVGY